MARKEIPFYDFTAEDHEAETLNELQAIKSQIVFGNALLEKLLGGAK